MVVSHVLLSTDSVAAAQHLTTLVRALAEHDIDQHVLAADESLVRFLGTIDRVTVGPPVRAPIMACCLMPEVDLTHAHDPKSAQTGLLLTLTRSVPYILTHAPQHVVSTNPIGQSIYRRACSIVCQTDSDVQSVRCLFPDALVEHIPIIDDIGEDGMSAEAAAAAYVRLYRRSIDSGRLPTSML